MASTEHPAGYASATPQRRPNSVRRTTSIELSWPGTLAGDLVMEARARDLRTGAAQGDRQTVHEDRVSLSLSPERCVRKIGGKPYGAALEGLEGASVLKGWRQRIEPIVQHEVLRARPVVVLLDDLVGCCTIATWMQVHWENLGSRENPFDRSPFENVCAGYATGSLALAVMRETPALTLALPLTDGLDASAFHPLSPDEQRTMRRVRRMDVWRENGEVHVDAMFQDSGIAHGTIRAALHEYRLLARLRPDDCGSHEIVALETVHGALPYDECLSAGHNAPSLVGWKLADLRAGVHRALKGPRGCTHLNDALRSMGEIDALIALLGPEGE